MALSNIFREPRREITESLAGFALSFGLLWIDYRFGLWLQGVCGADSYGHHLLPWSLGMIVGIAVAVVFMLFLFMTHSIGEGICNSLAASGLELRPRNRR